MSSLRRLCGHCRLFLSGESGWRLFCGVIYLGLSALMMCRLGLHWRSHVIGEFGRMEDLEGILWAQWYFKKALVEGRDFFFTNLIYYPVGYHLGAMMGRFLDAFMSIPLQFIFPGYLYYNVMCLLILFSDALSGYWLARVLSQRRSVALICGAIYAFNPYVLFEICHGRLGVAMIFFYPLFVIALINVFKRGIARDYLLASAVAAVGASAYWLNALLCASFAFFFVLWKAFRREMPARVLLGRALLLGLCCSALLLPLVLLLSPSYSSQGVLPAEPFPSFSSAGSSSWDIRYILAASAPLVNPFVFSQPSIFPTLLILSFTVPVLLLFAARRVPWFWMFCALFYFIFSLGPFLKIGGTNPMLAPGVPVSLPYIAAYNRFPFFHMFYYPYRFDGMVLCMLIPLIGSLFERFFDSRFRSDVSRFAVVAAYIVFLLCEVCLRGYGPMMAGEVRIPSFYRAIAAEKGGALINVPISCCHDAILYQTVHDRPILGGPGEYEVRRYPQAYRAFLDGNSFLQLFFSMDRRQYLDMDGLRRDIGALSALGFRYVVVHRKLFDKMVTKEGKMSCDEVLLIMESLCGPPVSVMDGQALFRLPGRPSE